MQIKILHDTMYPQLIGSVHNVSKTLSNGTVIVIIGNFSHFIEQENYEVIELVINEDLGDVTDYKGI